MKEPDYSYCQVIGITDRGLKRAANEDWLGERKTPNGWVAVVCDGMGGHVGGATASHIAVETILEYLSAEYFDDPRVAIGQAIDQANAAIQRKAAQQRELTGMGATCVLLIVRDGKVYIGHVGDSRIYLIRDHRIHQLTKDHSYVQMLVDAGEISQEEAEHHPRKNEITNALGIPQMQPATVMQSPIEPQAGDCFLLCSDGLSGMVDAKTIEHVVSQQMQLSAQDRAAKLIEKAKEGGGLDNITVQLVEFGATPTAASEGSKPITRQWWFWTALVVLIAAISALLYMFLPRTEKEEEMPIDSSKPVTDLHFGPLTANHDTIMLLSIKGTSDTCSVVLMDANGAYLETLEDVLWRSPRYQTSKIAVNYNGMPVDNKTSGIVRLVSMQESGFEIRFEAADRLYVLEVDVDRPKASSNTAASPVRRSAAPAQRGSDEAAPAAPEAPAGNDSVNAAPKSGGAADKVNGEEATEDSSDGQPEEKPKDTPEDAPDDQPADVPDSQQVKA